MSQNQEKLPLGISSCLLGQTVRFDGGHKRNDFIEQSLGQYFSFIPFCPEVEIGLGVPREPLRLIGKGKEIRCVGVNDETLDVTDKLKQSANGQNFWHSKLCGYIFKKDSPSCGMERVKIYFSDIPSKVGVGIYAKQLMANYPLLPVEEEGRLGDPVLRENFIQRVYIMRRWQQLVKKGITAHALTNFHSQHKLILMSHDQNDCRRLGKLLATLDKQNIEKISHEYIHGAMESLKKISTKGNHVNVLQHIQGYLKCELTADDKAELCEAIERYRLGQLPLIVPITLLKHHFRNSPDPFIDNSFYMAAYPQELGLQNTI